MLKNIDPLLSPDLLKYLMEMGHGDELVIADGNYPSSTYGKRVVRMDGIGGTDALQAILSLLPLDASSEYSVYLMDVDPGASKPYIWSEYQEVLVNSKEANIKTSYLERFDFYERSKQAYLVIATGERALYANIILKKGVVEE